MSYDKCKTISIKPKTNQIFVTVASNNVRPLDYEKCEYASKENCTLDDKLMYLMISMLDGNIQISQYNKSTIPFEYALLKVRNYYRNTDINEYGNKYDERHERYDKELSKYVNIEDWKERYKFESENKKLVNELQRNINRELYKEEFKIFKNSIKEDIKEKYYLKDDFGRVIEFVGETTRGYKFRAYETPNKDCLIDYKLAYIRKERMGDKYKIEKFEERQENKTNLEEEKDMRKDNFNEWLDNLVKENDIDILETYDIKKDEKSYCLEIKQVIECLKLLNKEEQTNIKNTMKDILEEGGTVKDYLIYLGLGCINTLNESNSEQEEEAM